ncbi:hypothetical protein ACI1P2_15140 [Paenibacillus sp. p-8]|uniref:WapI family immunity protein n=1 Tax=Paenibacillus jiagnxiensis TaxID=3228926 RepID=UPI0033B5CBF0
MDGPYLESGSIQHWQAEAEALCNTYKETGWFSAIEPELDFKLERDDISRQRFKVGGHLVTRRGERSTTLNYEFLTDVSRLRQFAEGLKKLGMAFPARNRPATRP